MIWFYILSLVIALGLFLFQIIFDKRRSVIQYVLIIGIIIANGGYVAFAGAQNLSEALLAVKITYVGGCFVPLLYCLTICEVCHIRIPKAVKCALYSVQSAIFAMVCTAGNGPYYYRKAEFYIENGIRHLDKVYGPLHMIFTASILGYGFMALAACIYAMKTERPVDRKSLMLLVHIFAFTAIVYEINTKVFSDIIVIPMMYTAMCIVSMHSVNRTNFYTVEENKDIVDKHLGKFGFITFDNKLRYMGCNEKAELIFPELKKFRIGHFPKDAGGELRNSIIEVLYHSKHSQSDDSTENRVSTFVIDGRTYDCVIHTLLNFRNVCRGYTVELKDETEHYNALELSDNFNRKLAEEVDEKTGRIMEIQQKTILGMAQMVESRDLSTGGHIKRTSEVVRIFSEKLLKSDMGFDPAFLECVIRSAPMHDLGKIGVDDAVLRKQGKFTDEEYEKMKKHSEIGAVMVRKILTGVEEEQFVEIAANIAHYHHEKVNGKGYPCGLAGDDIPVEARIMALADVFDALVSKRCYKESFSFDKAFEIIKADSGSHFDAKLAEIFLQCRPELEEFYSVEKSSESTE